MTVVATTGAVLGSGGAPSAVTSSKRRPLQREVRRPYVGTAQTAPQDEERQALVAPAQSSGLRGMCVILHPRFGTIPRHPTGPKAPADSSVRADASSNNAAAQDVSKSPALNDWDQALSDEW